MDMKTIEQHGRDTNSLDTHEPAPVTKPRRNLNTHAEIIPFALLILRLLLEMLRAYVKGTPGFEPGTC